MAARFVAEEGILKGLVLSLENGSEWIIGRDPELSQLLVEDPAASRRHVLCRITTAGTVIENLSETNPVQVNEEPINGPQLLHQGDSVSIGNSIFRFYSDLTAHVDDTSEGLVTPSLTDIDGKEINNESREVLPKIEGKEEMKSRHDTLFDEENTDTSGVLAEVNLDLLDTGRWLLKVIAGPNNGAEFAMQSDTSYVIGTDPASCDIVFQDVSVSRQHVRLTISKEDTLTIEDLKSRNGTLLDGKTLEGRQHLEPNALVAIGTTTFVVFDREHERHTIISPLLPAIVKVLQKEEDKKEAETKEETQARLLRERQQREEEERTRYEKEQAEIKRREKSRIMFGTLIIVSIISGLLIVAGMGTTLLFRSVPVESPKVDIDQTLATTLATYPSIKYSYNKTTGRLLLVGHVLSAVDRNQLLYNLQTFPFITKIDADNVIIDEYIWQEANQALAKSANWKGVTIHSPSPGRFVMTGYLRSRKQAEELNEYMNQNFPYIDLLEKRIVVEEEVVARIAVILQENGFRDILVKVNNGDVTLTGNIPFGQRAGFDQAIASIKEISGVRNINNLVAELPTEEAVVNLSENYRVTGSSTTGGGNISVVLKGKILSKNDVLDGMRITQITQSTIFLEKEGTKYRIDYNP